MSVSDAFLVMFNHPSEKSYVIRKNGKRWMTDMMIFDRHSPWNWSCKTTLLGSYEHACQAFDDTIVHERALDDNGPNNILVIFNCLLPFKNSNTGQYMMRKAGDKWRLDALISDPMLPWNFIVANEGSEDFTDPDVIINKLLDIFI